MIEINAGKNLAAPPIVTANGLKDCDARLIAGALQILAILREALKEATEAIDSGERFLEPSCNECTEGSTPIQFDRGLCWVHKARKLIGETR